MIRSDLKHVVVNVNYHKGGFAPGKCYVNVNNLILNSAFECHTSKVDMLNLKKYPWKDDHFHFTIPSGTVIKFINPYI